MVTRRLSSSLPPAWMFVTSLAIRHISYCSAPRVTLVVVLLILFWRYRVLKVANDIKERMPSGWIGRPSDSEDGDE